MRGSPFLGFAALSVGGRVEVLLSRGLGWPPSSFVSVFIVTVIHERGSWRWHQHFFLSSLPSLQSLNTKQVLELPNALGQILSEFSLLSTLSKNTLELFRSESVGTFPLIKLLLERLFYGILFRSHISGKLTKFHCDS